MLWELPKSTRTEIVWPFMEAIKRSVLGERWPVAAYREK